MSTVDSDKETPKGNSSFRALFVTAIIMLAGIVLTAILLKTDSQLMSERNASELSQSLARSAGVLIQPFLLNDDRVSLNYILNELSSQPMVTGMELTDPSGLRLGMAGDAQGAVFSVELTGANEILGKLSIWSDVTPIHAIIERQHKLMLAGAAGTFLLTLFSLWLSISSRPERAVNRVKETKSRFDAALSNAMKEQNQSDSLPEINLDELLRAPVDLKSDAIPQAAFSKTDTLPERAAETVPERMPERATERATEPLSERAYNSAPVQTPVERPHNSTPLQAPTEKPHYSSPLETPTERHHYSTSAQVPTEPTQRAQEAPIQAHDRHPPSHLTPADTRQVFADVNEYATSARPLADSIRRSQTKQTPPQRARFVEDEIPSISTHLDDAPEPPLLYPHHNEATSSNMGMRASHKQELNDHELVSLLKPEPKHRVIPEFNPKVAMLHTHEHFQRGSDPDDGFELEESFGRAIRDDEDEPHFSMPNNPLSASREETTPNIYAFEQDLELVLDAKEAAYLMLIDTTSAHAEYVDEEERAQLIGAYQELANSVAAIYNAEVSECKNGDLLLHFDEAQEDDTHGVNAVCAAMLFTHLYKHYNQSRIRYFQPVMNLHMALVRGRHDKQDRLLEEARFLTRNTHSNDLISHTALTEAPELKRSLLDGANIRRENEDKVLILQVGTSYHDLLEKQAKHLLSKLV
ncbi:MULTISPECIES: hypothetical protein [Nitrincola]|uniref:Putative membrane protein affecting hemolysin expression n=1 Tax=Nitrincola nitratireducens TaxID=1229521 RepID=W9UZH9_9GAMM|nr:MULTISPECIES: hypothetical protein [Nitrincola]EXJ10116.1 putative membrane protein affecting hemolysin expression [Nitrincola nitratireducens]